MAVMNEQFTNFVKQSVTELETVVASVCQDFGYDLLAWIRMVECPELL